MVGQTAKYTCGTFSNQGKRKGFFGCNFVASLHNVDTERSLRGVVLLLLTLFILREFPIFVSQGGLSRRTQ